MGLLSYFLCEPIHHQCLQRQFLHVVWYPTTFLSLLKRPISFLVEYRHLGLLCMTACCLQKGGTKFPSQYGHHRFLLCNGHVETPSKMNTV